MHFCTRNLIILLVRTHSKRNFHKAGVAKLVDATDLGSGAARRGGSSPSTRTIYQDKTFNINILIENIVSIHLSIHLLIYLFILALCLCC